MLYIGKLFCSLFVPKLIHFLASGSGNPRSSKRVEKNPKFLNAVREHMLKYAARAKPKNLDLIYSTTPLLKEEVAETVEKCDQYVEQHGDTFMTKIPKL